MIKKILIVITLILTLNIFLVECGGISKKDVLHVLRNPFDRAMERALELVVTDSPKEKRPLLEKIHYATTSFFHALMSPISLILWGTAGAIDSVTTSPSFTFLEGSGEAKNGPIKKIITWNVCMLFGGMPIPFGGVAPVHERIAEVSKKIISTDADIVCLQEVSPPAAHMLYQKLKSKYKYFYTRINPDTWLTLDSGLFVASKVAIQDPKVVPLPSSDMLKRALFTFKAGDYEILTTHLETGSAQEKQLDVILETTKNIKNNTLFLGDFNIARGDDFQKSGLTEIFKDLYKGATTATDYFSAQVRDIPPIDYSIDYILSTNDLRIKISTIEGYQIPVWADSDHHLLAAEIETT